MQSKHKLHVLLQRLEQFLLFSKSFFFDKYCSRNQVAYYSLNAINSFKYLTPYVMHMYSHSSPHPHQLELHTNIALTFKQKSHTHDFRQMSLRMGTCSQKNILKRSQYFYMFDNRIHKICFIRLQNEIEGNKSI